MNVTDELAQKIKRVMENELPEVVAEEAVEYSRTRFSEKAFDGKPWKPVSPKYKPRRGTLMVRSGALLNSIRVAQVTPNKVVISAGNSKVPYAQAHNEGFTGSVVVSAHARRTKKGKTVQVKAHKRMMRIPQRQFLGACPELERILKREAEALFKSILP